MYELECEKIAAWCIGLDACWDRFFMASKSPKLWSCYLASSCVDNLVCLFWVSKDTSSSVSLIVTYEGCCFLTVVTQSPATKSVEVLMTPVATSDDLMAALDLPLVFGLVKISVDELSTSLGPSWTSYFVKKPVLLSGCVLRVQSRCSFSERSWSRYFFRALWH